MNLSEIFCDNMILQADKPIRIYGESDGEVTVSLHGNSAKAMPENGRFIVELSPMKYGGPYELRIDGDGENITITNVYVGEVILCSGQSNMAFTMAEEVTPKEEYISDDELRLLVSHKDEGIAFEWRKCEASAVDSWSALCYHIGCGLRKKLGCAVGMVNASVGASIIQSWMHEDRYYGSEIELPVHLMHHDVTNPLYPWNVPGYLYHKAFERLIPYSVKGVVWYQGESNSSSAESEIYDKMLGVLAGNRREDLRDKELPFTIVQIANYTGCKSPVGWAGVQQAQMRAAETLPGFSCVISSDICEDDNIHPPTKYKLAQRICDNMVNRELFGITRQ